MTKCDYLFKKNTKLVFPKKVANIMKSLVMAYPPGKCQPSSIRRHQELMALSCSFSFVVAFPPLYNIISRASLLLVVPHSKHR